MNLKSSLIAVGASTLSVIGAYSIYKYFTKKVKRYEPLTKEANEIKPLDLKLFKKVLNEIMENVTIKLIVGNEILKEQEKLLQNGNDTLNDKLGCKSF
jgi:hypothetical protein